MNELPPVVSQAEYGRRGYRVLEAKYGTHQLNAWRRKGGRPKDPTLLEIREEERQRALAKAATRRARRVSPKRRAPIADFDSVT